MPKNFFDAEAHFESKIEGNSLRSQGVAIDFKPRPFCPTRKVVEKGIKRIVKERFKYEKFKQVNVLHNEYIKELKGSCSPDAFNNILYKAELTGAEIRINGRLGFVIEERKNSLSVIFEDDRVRIFRKAVWDFTYSSEGVDYLFFASGMKRNRFMR